MNSRRQDFSAGGSFIIIVYMVTWVIQSHGQSGGGKITWSDIAWLLVFMAIFASCIIDLYAYWKRRKESPEYSIIMQFGSKEDRDKAFKHATETEEESK